MIEDPSSHEFFVREEYIVPIFCTNLDILPSLAETRCSISVPPVPKRSSTKRFMIPATDFPEVGFLQ